MGRLVYGGIGSLDGFIADEQGDFDWSAPSDEVMEYLNVRDRAVTCELYGRRLYEVMKVWETYGTEPDASVVDRDFGQWWRHRDKVVFSTTIGSVSTSRTTLQSVFDAGRVRQLVEANDGDVSIAGPTLAAHALRAGIVDRLEYYASTVILGAGKHWLPAGVRLNLTLTDEHRFSNGVVHLAYDVN